MNIKKRILLLGLFSFLCLNAHSQFNTILKKKETKNISTELISDHTPDLKEITIINNSSKDTIITESVIGKTPLLHLPIEKIKINSPYGYRKDPFTQKKKFHYGIDLASSTYDVYAIMPGRIKNIGFEKKGLGNFVTIEHGDFTITYGHLYTTIGSIGDYVEAGQKVGITGNTGRSTGEHLHLAMKHKGKHIDPLPILQYIEKYLTEFKTSSENISSL